MNKQRWIRFALVLSALCLLAVFTLARDHDDRRAYQPAYRSGYDNGYSLGYNHGLYDRNHRARFNYDCREYRQADYGYQRTYGHRDQYRGGFQAAFQLGYRDGFDGRALRSSYFGVGYGHGYQRSGFRGEFAFGYSNGSYRDYDNRYGYAFDVGRQNGHERGLEKGRKDFDRGRSFDPTRHDAYRDADDGYHGDYGSKAVYRDGFRQGFEEGYRQGYGYGGYRRY